MALADLFLKQNPDWTYAQALEAERSLLRYFEILYDIKHQRNLK